MVPPCAWSEVKLSAYLNMKNLWRDTWNHIFSIGTEVRYLFSHYSRLQNVATATILVKPAVIQVHH